MKRKRGLGWILALVIGAMIGGLVGNYLSGYAPLTWLGYGGQIGMDSPLALDLWILKVTFGISFKFTIGNVIGILLGALTYKIL